MKRPKTRLELVGVQQHVDGDNSENGIGEAGDDRIPVKLREFNVEVADLHVANADSYRKVNEEGFAEIESFAFFVQHVPLHDLDPL